MNALDPRAATVSIRLVWSFARVAQQLGVSRDNPAMPLTMAESGSERTRVPWQMVVDGLAFTSGLAKRQDLGLMAASALRPDDLGTLARAMQVQPTLGDAMAMQQRHFRLLTDGCHAWTDTSRQTSRINVEAVSPLSLPRELAEFAVASQVAMARLLTGDPTRSPVHVGLRHRPPVEMGPYERFFQCPVDFAADGNFLVVDNTQLSTPLPHADVFEAERFGAPLQQELETLPAPTIGIRVKEMVLSHLRDGPPTAEQVAQRLHMSTRQLQRRLDQEGGTYRALVARTRAQLAEQYLLQTDLSTAEIAARLGFSSVHAFTRAVRRLLGAPPGEIRRRANAAAPLDG